MTTVNLLKTLDLCAQFSAVSRLTPIKNLGRNENDTEHSFTLALIAWQIINADNLPLDENLAIKYALVHDLVEVHADDVGAFDAEARIGKEEREKAALEKLCTDKNLCMITDLIGRYESRTDEESKFVWALDKILPALQVYDADSDWHKAHKISFEDWVNNRKPKAAASRFVVPYFEQVYEIVKSRPEMFYGKEQA